MEYYYPNTGYILLAFRGESPMRSSLLPKIRTLDFGSVPISRSLSEYTYMTAYIVAVNLSAEVRICFLDI